jgi:ferredoxin-thioredoxin reductase catalytic subunit
LFTKGEKRTVCSMKGTKKHTELLRQDLKPFELCCSSCAFLCSTSKIMYAGVQGLAEHKDTLGAPLCPCRLVLSSNIEGYGHHVHTVVALRNDLSQWMKCIQKKSTCWNMLMPFTNVMWCRHYDDKVAEVQQGFWNCPCVPMRERWVLA